MAILVTGGAGFIGSHTILELLEAGEEVVVLDDLSTGFRWAVDDRAEFVAGNAGNMALVDRIISTAKITAVMHFAGSIVVPESVADPLKYYSNNTCATRNLIEACTRGGVGRFVFSSTAAVYGETGLGPVFEDATLNPMSPYGRSKLMSEFMLQDVAFASSLRVGILRYFNVAGADPKGRTGQSTPGATHLIKVACQAALGQRPHIDIFGTDYETPDGTCIRDYIHVSDLAAAHLLMLRHLETGGESLTLNCGYGTGYSVRQVLAAVGEASGVPLSIREKGRRPGDPPAVVAGADKIRAILGWQPKYQDLGQIVKAAYNWECRLAERSTTAS